MSLVYDNSKTDSSFASILSRVIQPFKNGVQHRGIGGLMGSSRSFFLSSLWREHKKCLLVITPTLNDAEDYYQELLFFVGKHEHAVSASTERKQIFLYPPDEEFPFADASRHPEITSQKIEGLHHLMGSDQPPIIVAPVTALIRKSIPRAVRSRRAQLPVSKKWVPEGWHSGR
jgi:transcription-repair coupling factor (superfamily II helicase)